VRDLERAKIAMHTERLVVFAALDGAFPSKMV
jgi:hypothetical protein